MTAPSRTGGLAPGDCITILKQADKWRAKGYALTELPRHQRDDLTDCLQQIRRWIDTDPYGAIAQDAALTRAQAALEANRLGDLASYDLRLLWNYVITVSPARGRR